jgi:hypothetical protein
VEALRCRRCGDTLVAQAGQHVQCQSCLTAYSVKTVDGAHALLAAQSEHTPLPDGFICWYARIDDKSIAPSQLVICDKCSLKEHACCRCSRAAAPGQIMCDECSKGVEHRV